MNAPLSKLTKLDKWDYFKNPFVELKNSFCLQFYESLKRLEAKIGKVPFFKVQQGKITV